MTLCISYQLKQIHWISRWSIISLKGVPMTFSQTCFKWKMESCKNLSGIRDIMSREFEPCTLKSSVDKNHNLSSSCYWFQFPVFLHPLPGNRSFAAHRAPYFRVFFNKINLIKKLLFVLHKYSSTKERIPGLKHTLNEEIWW